MSHLEEREEKNCLNCNAQVHGKYCHICGQENIETKESAWHLVSHFFQDITHFDGKFFNTLRYLIWKPGFLSREYMNGRRASYLNPIRMYVFTSAFFFLLFFSFFATNVDDVRSDTNVNGKTLTAIDKMDSASFANFTRNINRNDKKPDLPMTRDQFKQYLDTSIRKSGISFANHRYKTRATYDLALAKGTENDGWIVKQITYRVIDINNKYHNNATEILGAFKSTLLHSLPQMLFISLPLLAFLLKLLYRRRKEFYYVNHAIFSVHLYIFIFIAMLLLFCLNELNGSLHWGILSFIIGILYVTIFFYEYKAMRNFYGQRRAKTVTKFLLLNLMFLFVLLILFVLFIFFSLFKI